MKKSSLLFTLALGFGTAATASAATQNYGTFVGTDVTYHDVTEGSDTDPLALFDAPTVLGNSLNFSPNSFESSTDGASTLSDITDSQLAFTLTVNDPTQSLSTFELTEAGDYTLIGAPGSFAYAAVAAPIYYQITEVGGVAVDGPSGQDSLVFTPSGGEFLLPAAGGVVNGIFTGSIQIDLLGLLTGTEFEGQAVTAAYITLNNTLATTSQGASSFIKKKDADGVVIEVTTIDEGDIPEPASAALLGLGLAAVLRRKA
ncbi:PEP-CTERM sorting domain-containing protein [Mucisphaera sp.]|uniref:PEP-CTERM sorting domain-containing protein n=1 Tax=Mucisphaera sp. TaxID=2913024 RepID=UPI003D09776F